MTIRVPRELRSPNFWNGRHWREKHRMTQAWEKDIYFLMSPRATELKGLIGVESKKRVAVTRECPSKRNFIRDRDNLFGACKPLLDSLQRLGLIVHDSMRWLVLEEPKQVVSPDGKFWTVIEIEEV